MLYYVTVNKKFRYIRVYTIVKRVGEHENKLSKAFAALIDKLITKQTGSL